MAAVVEQRRRLRQGLNVLMMPLVWVERAKGRWRLALLLLYALIAGLLGLFSWRVLALRSLPDVGDPFGARADAVPHDENAFVLYKQALAAFRKFDAEKTPRGAWPMPTVVVKNGWKAASPAARAWLEENREALRLWRLGTERPRAAAPPAALYDPDIHGNPLTGYLGFPSLAQLEAARLLDRGDVDEAWAYQRAYLRALRHAEAVRPLDLLGYGEAVGMPPAEAGIKAWAADPRVDAPRLRRALADLLALDAIVAASEPPALRSLFREVMRTIDAPPPEVIEAAEEELDKPWAETPLNRRAPLVGAVRWYVHNEPERSRRVARLLFANWLAKAEGAQSVRAVTEPELERAYIVREFGPDAPASARALAPEALVHWYASTSILKRVLPELSQYHQGRRIRETVRRDLLALLLGELYRREHGGRSIRNPYPLVDSFLKSSSSSTKPRETP